MGDTDNDRSCCSCEGRCGGLWLLRRFFLNRQCYIASGFFPLWHLVSKPFAPTVLTANVKLTDVLELDPEWDSYKVTASSHRCLLWTQHSLGVKAERPAAVLGAMLPSELVEGQGAAPTPAWPSALLTASRCNDRKQSHERDSYRLFFFFCLFSLRQIVSPITKVMLLGNWSEKHLCLWGSQTRQQMGFFS